MLPPERRPDFIGQRLVPPREPQHILSLEFANRTHAVASGLPKDLLAGSLVKMRREIRHLPPAPAAWEDYIRGLSVIERAQLSRAISEGARAINQHQRENKMPIKPATVEDLSGLADLLEKNVDLRIFKTRSVAFASLVFRQSEIETE